MTRGKQIIEEAKRIIAEAHERGNNNPMVDLVITLSFSFGAVWADAHPDIDVRTIAAWQSGYKEAVDKACEWLDENMNDVGIRFIRGDEIKDIVDLFRKAMKGKQI